VPNLLALWLFHPRHRADALGRMRDQRLRRPPLRRARRAHPGPAAGRGPHPPVGSAGWWPRRSRLPPSRSCCSSTASR
jgi:hypothetical protein